MKNSGEIHEQLVTYDEEGGGEMDTNGYDYADGFPFHFLFFMISDDLIENVLEELVGRPSELPQTQFVSQQAVVNK